MKTVGDIFEHYANQEPIEVSAVIDAIRRELGSLGVELSYEEIEELISEDIYL